MSGRFDACLAERLGIEGGCANPLTAARRALGSGRMGIAD
jgi:hypothetical protein